VNKSVRTSCGDIKWNNIVVSSRNLIASYDVILIIVLSWIIEIKMDK
jgi:hypothetical protein